MQLSAARVVDVFRLVAPTAGTSSVGNDLAIAGQGHRG